MKASAVADGIMRSLILTFEGVGLAVPVIYFFAVFRNRVMHISVTTMVAATISLAVRPRGPAKAARWPAADRSSG